MADFLGDRHRQKDVVDGSQNGVMRNEGGVRRFRRLKIVVARKFCQELMHTRVIREKVMRRQRAWDKRVGRLDECRRFMQGVKQVFRRLFVSMESLFDRLENSLAFIDFPRRSAETRFKLNFGWVV